MDGGSVSGDDQSASWKLRPPVDGLTQALVVSGFGDLPTGRALFLELSTPGGAWLSALSAVAPISNAEPPGKPEPDRAAAIAFTWTGLKLMGLAETALASFGRPFREGMMQEDRLRRLGDRRSGKWLETVIDGGPQWSGNTAVHPATAGTAPVSAFDVDDPGPAEEQIRTPLTVHVLLLLYASSDPVIDSWRVQIEAELAKHKVRIVHSLPLVLDPHHIGVPRVSGEHFGFADGLSQPHPIDEGGKVTVNGRSARPGPLHGVPLGEFLFGYLNGHREAAPGPVVPDDDQRKPLVAQLEPHPTAEGFFDFGLNGSYLVVRQLKQDVAAFWNSMDANAKKIRAQDPDYTQHVTADWIAERVVGRNRGGHLLCAPPATYLAADARGLPDSSYRFHEADASGAGCPPGSHVRRANPRDALSPSADPGARETALKAANNHRILRRGRKFGTKIADERKDDEQDRGLLFMCINTDIARQFEFVQQTWLLNSNFATLLDEVDPLVGPAGRMTIREQPLRRTVHVETFVKMAGGDYFFLPSLPALNYLALL